jgi:hypothetical protein
MPSNSNGLASDLGLPSLNKPAARAGAPRPTALFVLSTGHLALRELLPVLLSFNEAGWRVVAYVGRSGPQAAAAVEELGRTGIHAALIPTGVGYEADEPATVRSEEADEKLGASAPAPSGRPTGSAVRDSPLKAGLRRVFVHRLVAFWRYYRRALCNRKWAARIVTEHSPDAVLLNMFHSVGEVDNAVLRSSRQAGIPVHCLTNSPYLGELAHRVARLNHLRTGMAGPDIKADYDLLNRLVAHFAPSWTRTLGDGTVVFYWDPVRILAAKAAGLGMNRMWLKPSLDFDKVFVFSEFSRDLLLESGYPAQKIVVAGQPLLDEILQRRHDPARQRQISSHIGVPTGKPYLLLNIEPAMEHDYARADEHWRHFHEVMRACHGHGLPVVLSLHPLCSLDDYRFAEAQYGARISTDVFIHELYPSCAVSVSFPCSTNLLALRFRKPLIVYDFYNVIDRDAESARLNRLPGMLVARTEDALWAHIAAAVAPARSDSPAGIHAEEACSIILETVGATVQARPLSEQTA